MDYLTLKDVDVANKKVIVRAGFDVPLDEKGSIEDDKRIRDCIPTVKYLLSKNASVIIISHMGRPEGKVVAEISNSVVAKCLSKILGKPVKLAKTCIGEDALKEVKNLKNGEILLLENLRFNKEEKSKDQKEKDEFGKKLASYGEIYVNEAFSNSHRNDASMTSIPQYILGCAGLSLDAEYRIIKNTVAHPKSPFIAIVGGMKTDKLQDTEEISKRADKVLIVGSLGYALLSRKGIEIGKTKVKGEIGNVDLILNNKKIILPEDAIIAEEFKKDAHKKTVDINNIQKNWMVLDIGPRTLARIKKEVKLAKTVVWFGPIGVFEWRRFSKGTKEVAQALAKSKARVIIGGGDSAAAVDKLKLAGKMTHVSTGGGASLEMFKGHELESIKALVESKKRFWKS